MREALIAFLFLLKILEMLWDFVVDMKGQRWYNLIKINFFYLISQRKSKEVIVWQGLVTALKLF